MAIQPVSKTKHSGHSRILEQRDLERMQNSEAIVKSCQDTVQRSRELVRRSRDTIKQIRNTTRKG